MVALVFDLRSTQEVQQFEKNLGVAVAVALVLDIELVIGDLCKSRPPSGSCSTSSADVEHWAKMDQKTSLILNRQILWMHWNPLPFLNFFSVSFWLHSGMMLILNSVTQNLRLLRLWDDLVFVFESDSEELLSELLSNVSSARSAII